MYTVVMLAAMATGEAAPAHGWGKRDYLYGACYGACYGVCYAGYEGYVQAAGGWGYPWAGYACYGGCGGYASVAYGAPPAFVQPPTMFMPYDTKSENGKKDDKDADKKKDKGKDKEAPEEDKDRAEVIFDLPAGAKLYVDDHPITNIDTRKQFRTPALKRGEKYYYELRVEVVRDGKPVSETKRVTLSAGDVIKATFAAPTTGVANAR